MSWISFVPVLSILALCPLYLYVITIRSWCGGVDRRPGRPEDPEGLPRHPEDPEGRTGRLEDVRDQGRQRRPIRFTPIRDWIPIRHCLLDTLRSQIEWWDELAWPFTFRIPCFPYLALIITCYCYYEWELGYGNIWCDSPCLLEDASTYMGVGD